MLCLAAANGMLFSGGQDQTIRVWKFDPAANAFGCTAILRAEQGGHTAPVNAMCASGPFLFSGDFRGNIKVWDLTAGSVRQAIDRAHSGGALPAITDLLVWEGHLISASLDGLIKVWEPAADASTGAVVNPAPIFNYPSDLDQQQQQQPAGGRGRPAEDLPGILALAGVQDVGGKAVLMASYNGEKVGAAEEEAGGWGEWPCHTGLPACPASGTLLSTSTPCPPSNSLPCRSSGCGSCPRLQSGAR